MRFSASRLKTWMNCSLQAKYKYIDRLPEDRVHAAAVFGSCMHLALDRFNSGQLDLAGAKKLFADAWTNPKKYGLEEPMLWAPRTSFGQYMKSGKDALDAYAERVSWRGRLVIATEHSFLVTLGDYELTGVVDHLEVTKDRKGRECLMVLDHKTGRTPTIAQLQADIQFSLYSYASRQPEFWLGNGPDFPPMELGEWHMEMTKDLPRLHIWHSVMQGKEYNCGERDEADFERLHRALQQIERAMELEVFVPDISGESCGWCPYREPCRLPIHDPVEAGPDW
jgi:RecB family exonuclease